MPKVTKALVSASDKTGLVEFVKFLADGLGTEILSTGGTGRTLVEAGIKVVQVEDYTRSPELLDGRVKTLHPKVHAGILYRRDLPTHAGEMKTMGWDGIDMVVVTLYPFEQVIRKPETTLEEAVENIDIGGPCLLRAAAKNHAHVIAVSSPDDYGWIRGELEKNGGWLSEKSRRKLAQAAFTLTSRYDSAISAYLAQRL
ncbi:MAG: IMP cyclohydrolase [Deltaproteobacteria bacterium]|jgi:phosphoribosylaminoimidazolecarboxamide formyltransferase/IMP cyclohydrolase|nr:IMP cyclohydrolase [Deltaproteobacteria bacterium]